MAEPPAGSDNPSKASGLSEKFEEVAKELEDVKSPSQAGPENGVNDIVELFRKVLTQVHKDLDSSKENQKKPDEDPKASKPSSRPIISEVRKVDFEHFKNHFSEDDSRYMLEVLVAGSNLAQAVRVEGLRRNGVRTTDATTEATAFPPDSTTQRVRIQSKAILNYLSKLLTEASELNETRTFLYPFRPLIYSHENMCRILHLLTEQCKVSTSPPRDPDVQEPNNYLPGQTEQVKEATSEVHSKNALPRGADSSGTVALDPGFDTAETLAEMKAYVHFVEQDLLPLKTKYSGTSKQTVTFDDLWLLFTPGEYIVVPTGPQSVWKQDKSIYHNKYEMIEEKTNPSQRLWRLFGVTTPDEDPNFLAAQAARNTPARNPHDPVNDNPEPTNACFYLHCYHIDFDESKPRAVTRKIRVAPFKGAISIKSLPAYPSRYIENIDGLKEELKVQGHRSMDLRQTRHLHYKGWSLAHHPDGRPLAKEGSLPWNIAPLEPQYIDSEVIIDFEEMVNRFPQWSPSFKPPESEVGVWSHSNDNFEIMHWSDSSRTELKSQRSDVVQTGDGVAISQRNKTIENDRFLTAAKDRGLGIDEEGAELGEEDFMLLPKRLYAYSLRDRSHVALDIDPRFISKRPEQHGVFEQLKIPRTTKDLIRSLIDEHLEKKRLEDLMTSGEKGLLTQDLIGGKGKGLTILLHGVPGVGKTATAEAVALESRKPLFSLSPGDIGSTASEVSRNLRNFFRLANKWNCILLLDEADAFLSQRSAFDTERNAMVSVFLQALEYYDGILFLTTNRVGQMDEAFQSRIHLKLYYQPLDEKQTEQIFRANIKKLRENDAIRRRVNKMPELAIDEAKILAFATRPFRAAGNIGNVNAPLSPAQWNGRQIRNAFHLASSLAYRSMAEELAGSELGGDTSRLSAVILDDKQFQVVVKTMQAFDKYIEKTKGFSAADLAFMAGNRADFWREFEPRGAPYDQRPPAGGMDTRNPFYRDDSSGSHEPQQRASQTFRTMYTPEAPSSRSNMSFQQEGPYASRSQSQFEGARGPPPHRRAPDTNFGHAADPQWTRHYAGYAGRSPPPGWEDPPTMRNPGRRGGESEYDDQFEESPSEFSRSTLGGRSRRLREEHGGFDDDYD
ncbi:hypothetical protein N0V82_010505 [Gnomoniopsis sp. IMI 355080]|nr:hypothetical protein N0V82_010505 [Gnomoniopsis sp. IMI 355080]